MRATLEIYQGTERTRPLIPVTLRARLADASGRTVRDQAGTLGVDAFNGRHALVSLDIDRLPPGEYVLSVEAAADRQTARRTMRFAVK